MNNATRIERLRHLVKVLKAVKPRGKQNHRLFDMKFWFRAEVVQTGDLEVDAKSGDCKLDTICQTSACALGHAALDPKFQKLGLGITMDFEVNSPRDRRGSVTYRNYGSAIDVGGAFFGIDEYEARELFMPDAYREDPIRPRHVIKRVEALIKQYSA